MSIVVSDELSKLIKKFRLRRIQDISVLVFQIDPVSNNLSLEEQYDDIEDLSELQEELPGFNPRFLLISFVWEHSDGRKSFPLVFLWSPPGANHLSKMVYTTNCTIFQQFVGVNHIKTCNDKEELSNESIEEFLSKFKV